MPERLADPNPPRGLLRLLARAPIWLYRARLGWMFGNRFLLLTHIGRRSGLPRHVVLEVVRHDSDRDTYFVASAWGEKADWLRNVQQTPKAVIHVGRRRFDAIAERLTPQTAELQLLDYGRRHPTALKNLARIMGYRLTDSEADYRALGRSLPVVALRPARADGGTQARERAGP